MATPDIKIELDCPSDNEEEECQMSTLPLFEEECEKKEERDSRETLNVPCEQPLLEMEEDIKADLLKKPNTGPVDIPCTSRWFKLRTTVKVANTVPSSSVKKRRKSALSRQDSFLKKFSTLNAGGSGCATEMEKEQKETRESAERCHNDFVSRFLVFNPDDNFMFIWLGIISLTVLYNFWTCILREAFIRDYHWIWITMDALSDFIYLCDIGMNIYNKKNYFLLFPLLRFPRSPIFLMSLALIYFSYVYRYFSLPSYHVPI